MDFAYFQTTLDHDHAHTIPFRTIQDFKRPKRTKYFHSVQNQTRPNETILDHTRLAKTIKDYDHTRYLVCSVIIIL